MKSKAMMTLLVCFYLFRFSTTAKAEDANVIGMLQNLQKQMFELQTIVMAQKAEIDELKARGAGIQMGSGAVSPEGVSSMSEGEFKERLSHATGGANKWLENLHFNGDIRMRYEPTENSRSTTNDVNRFRFRLRYGLEKIFNGEWKAGFRLASGAVNDPTSTNQTMEGAFTNKTITIDQAYAIYTPKWALIGPISDAEIGIGKVGNPLSDVHSWLTWDGDVTPEGLYEKVSAQLLKTNHLSTSIDFLATQFLIDEGNAPHGDAELYGFSAGLRNSEVRNLKIIDVDSKRMVLYIRDSKGGVSREALLSPTTLNCLRKYERNRYSK